MIEKVYLYAKKYKMFEDCSSIIVGLSGGADSVCLLIVLKTIIEQYNMQIKLIAVHINHGIRGAEAKRDEEFAKRFCEVLHIDFEVYCEDVPKLAKLEGLTEEEAGRVVRYRAFDIYAQKYNAQKIAVAHHMDDLAETVLMNIFRGSGIRGAAGIVPVRDNIIRPLLCVQRSQIEDYLSKLGQTYVTDSTNSDNLYTRNQLRNQLIPYVKEHFNANVVEKLAYMAQDFAMTADYLDSQVCECMRQCVMPDNVEAVSKADSVKINIEKLAAAHDIIKRRLILSVLSAFANAKKDIYRSHVEYVLKVLDMQAGKQINLPYGIYCRRSYEYIVFGRERQSENQAAECKDIAAATENGRIAKMCNSFDVQPAQVQKSDEWQLIIEHNELENVLCKSLRLEFDVMKNIYSGNSLNVLIERIIIENTEKSIKFDDDDYTKYFDYDKISGELCFRFRQSGDKIVINSDGTKKKLKKEFIDRKIPSEQRNNVLLMATGDNILWAAGVRRSEDCLVDNESKRILKISIIVKDTF